MNGTEVEFVVEQQNSEGRSSGVYDSGRETQDGELVTTGSFAGAKRYPVHEANERARHLSLTTRLAWIARPAPGRHHE
jgi:hypothetical protein